jgi:hemoglobin-like flavoprotein
MLDDQQKSVLRDSWRLVVPIADTAADLFYRRLFELKPEYRAYFKSDLASQKRKLIAMLAFIVKSVDWPDDAWRESVAAEDDLFLIVLALGRRHSLLYKIPDETYETVGEALLWTLDFGLGKAFTPDVRAVWTQLYGLLALTMKLGRLSVQSAEDGERAIRKIVDAEGHEAQVREG